MITLRQITTYLGTIPKKAEQDPITFSEAVGEYLDYFSTLFTPATNSLVDDINQLTREINTTSISMEGYTNYKGEYDPNTIYAQGESVSIGSDSFVSKTDNNIGFPPADYPAKWLKRATNITKIEDDISPKLASHLDANGFSVQNYTISTNTGIELDLQAANILIANLTADSTISFINIPTGTAEWMVEIKLNGFTPTWDSRVEWDREGDEPEWTAGTDTAYFYTTDSGTTIKAMRVREGA